MAEIVLRVRLIGGEHLDVSYDEPGATPDDALDNVIAILAQADGALRCRHGAGSWCSTAGVSPPWRRPRAAPFCNQPELGYSAASSSRGSSWPSCRR